MAASISMVAAICAPAPSAIHGQYDEPKRGSDAPVTSITPASERQRERKAEQEAHMRGADGAERRGQFALHGVARGLARRRDQRENDPEPTGIVHRRFRRVSRA